MDDAGEISAAGGTDGDGAIGTDSAGQGVPAPRPIAPLSTSTVTSQTPRFRWALASGQDGAEVEICRDRGCTSNVSAFRASGTSGAPPTALPKGVYFWRLRGTVGPNVQVPTSPVWEFVVGARSAPVNSSSGTMLDLNGDGLAEVVVGAWGASNYTGAAYVYSFGPNGLSSTTAIYGPAQSAFGFAVASAGDVNGDGFADLVVGANTQHGAGAAYLYLGGPQGPSTEPAVALSPLGRGSGFGASLASAGDVNGDGYADLAVALRVGSASLPAFLYMGSPAGLSTTPITLAPSGPSPAVYSACVASAGDVNGDGFADLLVGNYLYLGGPNGLAAASVIATDGSSGGFCPIAGAGDVNADGFSDVIVGADLADNYAGRAYVYFGSATGLGTAPVTLTNPAPRQFSRFGSTVAGAGDVNGDGFADVVVGAEDGRPAGPNGVADVNGGAAWLYVDVGISDLPTARYVGLPPPTPQVQQSIPSLAGAGDVDGDGLDDILAGYAIGDTATTSSVYVYPGTADGTLADPLLLADPGRGWGTFGFSIASLSAGAHGTGVPARMRSAELLRRARAR